MAIAALQGCAMLNLSTDESRLVFPQAIPSQLSTAKPEDLDQDAVEASLKEEARLGYFVPSGKYWKEEDRFDPAAIDALDSLWLRAVRHQQTKS